MPHLIMLPSINQYTEPPIDIPNNPIQEPQAQNPKEGSKSISKYLLIAVGLVILAVIVYFVFFSGSGQTNTDNQIDTGEGDTDAGNTPIGNEPSNPVIDLSKNGICDPQENCFDYPTECKCRQDEYCSSITKKCTTTTCGNKACEIDGGESEETCCLDCTCTIPGQMCNAETKACEEAKMNLTKERAVEVIKAYFDSQGIALNLTEPLGVFEYNQALVQRIKIQKSDEPFSRQFGVTESEEVIDFHTI